MFSCPLAAHSSAASAIGDDGVMGYIAATSENAYATCEAAVFPSIVIFFIWNIPPYFDLQSLLYHRRQKLSID